MHENVLHVIVEGSEVWNEVTDVGRKQILLNNLVRDAFQGSEVVEDIVDRIVLAATKHGLRRALRKALRFRFGIAKSHQCVK